MVGLAYGNHNHSHHFAKWISVATVPVALRTLAMDRTLRRIECLFSQLV